MNQIQINKLKKNNDVHENEFVINTNKHFEKKCFEENNIPSFGEYPPSVDLDNKYNLCDKYFNDGDASELTVKPFQSNFEIVEPMENSDAFDEKIKNIIQKEFNFTFNSTSSRTKNEIDAKSENNINIYLKEEKINKEKKNLGRKRKGEHEEREHTKFKPDNKIRKIKSHFTKFIYSYLGIFDKNKKLLKMKKCINEDLGKKFNMNLMKMTLREMLIKFNKSDKGEVYISQLINEVFKYRDQKEIDEKLNKTYIEVLEIMRNNHHDKFKADILTEELERGENEEVANDYANELVKQLKEYEEWFTEKKERNSKKAK